MVCASFGSVVLQSDVDVFTKIILIIFCYMWTITIAKSKATNTWP